MWHTKSYGMEDDYFDDTAFDQLLPNTLQELEQRARRSTQHSATRSVNPHQVVAERNSPPHEDRTSFAENSPSDYGLDDEDVVDLDAQSPATEPSFAQDPVRPIPDEATQREQWRQQKYGAPALFRRQPQSTNTPFVQPLKNELRPPALQAIQQNGYLQPLQPTKNELPVQHTSSTPPLPTELMDSDMLQARIVELEKESAHLRKDREDAINLLSAKRGEISIVRSNQEKIARKYELRITELQRQHSEDVARQKMELETAQRVKEKVQTSNRFLEHDLAQEAERAKTARNAVKGAATAEKPIQSRESPTATPKKNKSLPFRDGFNDDEAMMLTPSRYREKTKQGTPKAGSKRKRAETKSHKSPSKPLSFHEPVASPVKGNELPPVPPSPSEQIEVQEPLLISQHHADGRFDFTQMILEHRLDPGHARTLEIMSTHFLPSRPKESFASVLYDALSQSSTSDLVEYRQYFCQTILDLWSSCLEQRCYAPFPELPTLLQHILMTVPSRFYATLIPRLVPLCLHTADIIAIPTAKHSKNSIAHAPPSPEHIIHIDPLFYLEFLQQVVTECELLSEEGSSAALETFWSSMEFDFVLLMLHRSQPLEQIFMMLQLLSSSSLPSSFGAIVSTRPSTRESTSVSGVTTFSATAGQHPSPQAKSQSDILDRLTVLLFETPEPPILYPTSNASESKVSFIPSSVDDQSLTRVRSYSRPTLLHLRTRILNLLHSLCLTHFGGALLSTHRLAIGRLVRFLHESILHLYSYTPETHSLISEHVNRTVALLAHATSVHADVVDLRRRLASVGMGEYKFLVGLGRCAFAECGGNAVNFDHKNLDSLTDGGSERQDADTDMDIDEPAPADVTDEEKANGDANTNAARDSDKWKAKTVQSFVRPAQSLLESSIWTQTADEAHRMLDEWLTPAEGEAVVGVLGSAGASGGGEGVRGGRNAVNDGNNLVDERINNRRVNKIVDGGNHVADGGSEGDAAVDEDTGEDQDDEEVETADEAEKADTDGDTAMRAAV